MARINLDHHELLMATIIAALTNFGQSLAAIGMSLLYSVLAVFQAIFALIQSTIESILKLGQSITTLVLELFQGVFGFVFATSLQFWLLVERTTYTRSDSREKDQRCCRRGSDLS